MTNETRQGRIAFQGENGANSDMACRDMFPAMEAVPCLIFDDAFKALQDGDVDLAMIPIENSLAGRVADIHHLLPNSNLHIIGEYFLPIHFHLMAKRGTKLEDIHEVHSHIHARGQTRSITLKHGWDFVVAADTAGAARWVSEQDDISKAAFAPELAAELYDLDILARNVEDAEHNTTRFVVLSREPETPTLDEDVMTTFVFKVRNIPAALYKAMGGFATNGVNMTKLESYQINGQFTATQFYADIEGHIDDKAVQRAMDELKFFADVSVLGVYPQAAFRKAKNSGL